MTKKGDVLATQIRLPMHLALRVKEAKAKSRRSFNAEMVFLIETGLALVSPPPEKGGVGMAVGFIEGAKKTAERHG